MRVVRGTEIGSDHHLVLMMVRLTIQRQKSCIEREMQAESVQTREYRAKVEIPTRIE